MWVSEIAVNVKKDVLTLGIRLLVSVDFSNETSKIKLQTRHDNVNFQLQSVNNPHERDKKAETLDLSLRHNTRTIIRNYNSVGFEHLQTLVPFVQATS